MRRVTVVSISDAEMVLPSRRFTAEALGESAAGRAAIAASRSSAANAKIDVFLMVFVTGVFMMWSIDDGNICSSAPLYGFGALAQGNRYEPCAKLFPR
jgi:hypothetical protein